MTNISRFGYHETTTAASGARRHRHAPTQKGRRQLAASAGHARHKELALANTRMFRSAQQQLEKILGGDQRALNQFVAAMTPVIQARVSRVLLRGSARDLRQDVKDHTQDVFMHLFADGAKALHRWQDEGGLSLENFVGLIAQRRTISTLRSGKRNPWREDGALDDERDRAPDDRGPAAEVETSDALATLLELLRQTLSPLGWHLFQLLYIDEKSVNEVRAATGLKADAVYAWRSRLRRTARECKARLEPAEGPATNRGQP